MRERSLAFTVIGLGLLVLSGCEKKEETVVTPASPPPAAAPATPAPVTTVPQADADFAMKAAGGGLAEVEASRTVSEKTANESVRQFAQMLVNDHAAANQELVRIAQAKQLILPTAPDVAHQEALAKLKSAMGTESDRIYVQDFGLKAHQDAVALFEREANEGMDPELKAFAAKTLPSLKTHLEHAQRLAQGLPQ